MENKQVTNMNNNLTQTKDNKNKIKRKRNLNKTSKGLLMALCLTGVVTIGAVGYAMNESQKRNGIKAELQNVYSRNFYELVDNVNNAEVKFGKVVASDNNEYSKKLLNEISKNCVSASNNLSSLPTGVGGIEQTITFINQVGGYTQTLSEKLGRGAGLTTAEQDKLMEIYMSIQDLQANLQLLNQKVVEGYDIYEMSKEFDGDYNLFNDDMQGLKNASVDYPTMIYDGPFSDSVINKEIKGLNYSEVEESTAKANILKFYKDVPQDNIEFLGETNGRFNTYDYRVHYSDDNSVFVQMTKKGGKLLTISGSFDSAEISTTISDAKSRASTFIANAGFGSVECVWSDSVQNDLYLNFAPVVNGIIYYPDLIKVKVDLASGMVLGFEASSYFTNHTQRQITSASYEQSKVTSAVPKGYNVETNKLVLAPIEYEEILCYEIKTTYQDSTYYFYYNANSGKLENILRVIKTEQGNKLM